jgi:hypothetical protein
MRIDVTWRDIIEGRRRRTTACMVALALKRELGTEYASVGLRDARVRLDGRYVTLSFPREVGRKIRFWELFHFALPFSFDFPGLMLDAPLAEPPDSKRRTLRRLTPAAEPAC